MADDKDKVVVEEPKANDQPTETPKTEEPVTPITGAATPAGTDQQGRQLYDVKCAECGKDTQVPFQPTGDRPVYCRDCYMQKKGG